MAAERDILPRLDLVSSYSSDSTGPLFDPGVEQTFGLEFPDWSVRLELSIPIGNTAARAERDSARLEVEQRRRLLYDAELEVSLAVRDAVRALEQLAESIQRGQESVRLESTNLNREIAKRDVGSSTTFDVQQVTQQLLEARLLSHHPDLWHQSLPLDHEPQKLAPLIEQFQGVLDARHQCQRRWRLLTGRPHEPPQLADHVAQTLGQCRDTREIAARRFGGTWQQLRAVRREPRDGPMALRAAPIWATRAFGRGILRQWIR